MPFSATASAKAAIKTPGGFTRSENFLNILNEGAPLELKQRMDTLDTGPMALFREMDTKQHTVFHRAYHGSTKPVALSSDTEPIPLDDAGEGFGYSISTYVFKKGIIITQELMEEQNYGVISGRVAALMEDAEDSINTMAADAFNRGFGTVDAPFVCEDGMYLIDSGRPNPVASAGTWSNLEAAGAITLDGIFQANLNFSTYRDEIGRLRPMELKMLVVRPEEEKTVLELLKSEKRPTDAQKAASWSYGRFQYTVLRRLTTGAVFYFGADPKSEKNELQWQWLQRPNVSDFQPRDQDSVQSRVRYRAGFGCGRPYAIRGALLA